MSIIKNLRMGTISAFTTLPRVYSITIGLNSHKSYMFLLMFYLSSMHIKFTFVKARSRNT